jgi:3'(2'), 5'-bisphosphate nucleotidase
MSQDLLKIAIESALQAAKKIVEIYQSDDFDIQLKSDDSPLTKADIASHNIIESYLKNTQIPILSEEGKDIPYDTRKEWNKLWIVDPIDGTKEFIKRNGEFTVNIALVENQQPTLGVIYAPILNDLYFSLDGMGAFKVKVDLDNYSFDSLIEQGIQLPIDRQENIYTIVASRSHLSTQTQEFIDDMKSKHGDIHMISKGSSLKLCMVAEGLADCYPRFAPTMEWDTAAGQAICSASGFKLIDWQSKSVLKYNRPNLRNDWFIVN